ncbi:MAG: Sua5/YciO/YrdC/YwlC family protein, partial [Paracoccaceae bacterium]
ACLRDGGIVAVKGIGGFHLVCDAASHAAVLRLRHRKARPDKPLAVMFPQKGTDGLAMVHEHVSLDPVEAAACLDPVRPIVLARRRVDSPLSTALAPGLSELGVFLPYSPLHHVLLGDFDGPLVATSGNISGEPVITENDNARRRLGGIADAVLHHDRPILRPADDTVIRVISSSPRILRAGRGKTPLEFDLSVRLADPVIAVGGHMKSAVALAWDNRVVVSPHIGELDSPHARAVFAQTINDLQALHQVRASRVICDPHPGYASTRWAHVSGLPVTDVGHHVAHASALAGEYPEVARWLTFTWDGAGLGADGSIWGGEAFAGTAGGWRRVASLRPFHLLGGDRAAREPWRSAAALMWQEGRDWTPTADGADLARQAWDKRIGTFPTSSAGRLFDAAAALVAGIHTVSHEGRGPMALESMAASDCEAIHLPQQAAGGGVLQMDWAPLLPMLVDSDLAAPVRAGMFHEALAAGLVAQALALHATIRFEAVGLSGGVFQNRLLCERIAALFAKRGIPLFQHAVVPANDGGLAFGQIVEYAHSHLSRSAPPRKDGL